MSPEYCVGLRLLLFCMVSLKALVSTHIVVHQFQINTIPSLHLSYGEVLGTSTAYSQLRCVSKCSVNNTCRSATYDVKKKICKLNRWHSDAAGACDPGSECLVYADKYIQTTMRLPCNRDADCVDPSSLCVLNQCQCEPGYSYNGTSYACVEYTIPFRRRTSFSDDPKVSGQATRGRCLHSCSSYGTTFQPDYNKKLYGNNLLAYPGVTLETCKSNCVNETSFVCRTIEYVPDISKCWLQNVTALDIPGAYLDTTGKELYTRDCAN